MASAPSFIERDGSTIISEMVALYESYTGRTIHPAQAEQLLINAFAFRELLLREEIQSVAEQMLVDFAVKPALDYLGALVAVTRLPAAQAGATIQFTLVSGHGDVVIPDGLRVASSDGQVIFSVAGNIEVASADDTVDVEVFCDTSGIVGNGYVAGDISKILDPQPFLASAANLDTTSGGSDEESDDALRARIKIAPSQFSVAGSREAYVFHAKSASAAIIDVAVTSPVPGQVNIYPLVAGGIATPSEVLSLVEAICSGEKVRPLTDTVVVASPTIVDYDIEIEVEIYEDADPDVVIAKVEELVSAYRDARAARLGMNIVINQLVALAVYDNEVVYSVNIVSPASDVDVEEMEVAICGSLEVTVSGTNVG